MYNIAVTTELAIRSFGLINKARFLRQYNMGRWSPDAIVERENGKGWRRTLQSFVV